MNNNEAETLIEYEDKQIHTLLVAATPLQKKNMFSFFKALGDYFKARSLEKRLKEERETALRSEKNKQLEDEARINAIKSEEQRIIDEKKQVVIDKVDSYIENNMLSLVFDIEKTGYQLTDIQKTNFENKIKLVLLKGNTEFLVELMKQGYVPSNEFLINWISDTTSLIENNKNNAINFISVHMYKKWNEVTFMNELFQSFVKGIITIKEKSKNNYLALLNNKENSSSNNKDAAYLQILVVNLFSKIEPFITLDDYLNILNITKETTKIKEKARSLMLKNRHSGSFMEVLLREKMENTIIKTNIRTIPVLIETMQYQLNINFKNDKEKILEKIQRSDINDLIKNKIIAKSTDDAKKVNLNELPETAKDLLKIINDKIYNTLQEKEDVKEEYINTIKLLWDKRIPEILEKYLKIAPEYREDFKNIQGKTPTQLMQEALTDINEVLEVILENINHDKVSSLSASARYTKEIKNNIHKI